MEHEGERKPAVDGAFYPKEEAKLASMTSKFIEAAKIEEQITKSAVSFIAPHAGYTYSGSTAGFTYKALKAMLQFSKIDTFFIIGPNHTGYGTALSLSNRDWLTPLGVVKNDIKLTEAISKFSDFFAIEEEAHLHEHSIEVQLPFLQQIVKDPKCVFLCMGDQSYESSLLVSNALLSVEKETKRKIALIASSDLNHYESAEVAKKKDMPALESITKLDMKRFVRLIEELNDTACGYGPMTVAGLYAASKKAKKGHILDYSNSGSVTKDYNSVVSYASIVFA